jgi:hypothetical protein
MSIARFSSASVEQFSTVTNTWVSTCGPYPGRVAVKPRNGTFQWRLHGVRIRWDGAKGVATCSRFYDRSPLDDCRDSQTACDLPWLQDLTLRPKSCYFGGTSCVPNCSPL